MSDIWQALAIAVDIGRVHEQIAAANERMASFEAALAVAEKERDVLRAKLAHASADADQAIAYVEQERDAAQRDAATLRGALEGLVAAWDAMDASAIGTKWDEAAALRHEVASGAFDVWLVAARRALAPAPAQATSEEGKP